MTPPAATNRFGQRDRLEPRLAAALLHWFARCAGSRRHFLESALERFRVIALRFELMPELAEALRLLRVVRLAPWLARHAVPLDENHVTRYIGPWRRPRHRDATPMAWSNRSYVVAALIATGHLPFLRPARAGSKASAVANRHMSHRRCSVSWPVCFMQQGRLCVGSQRIKRDQKGSKIIFDPR